MRTRLQVRVPEAAAFVSVCAVTVAVAADSGGFFARTWGWATICLSAVAASSLVLMGDVGVGGLATAALALLVCVDAWIGLSATWSQVPADSLREAERGLVYVSALLAGLVLGRAGRSAVVAGVAVAAGGVAAYGLGTRLFPSRPAAFQPVEGTLLIDPLGYANALGLLAAIGILLFLVFSVHARAAVTRSLSGAAVIVLLPALVLTSSRGSWIALWVGLLVVVLLDPVRSRLVVAACAIAPAAAVVVWSTVRSPALRDKEATLQEAARAGHRLAVAIALLAIVAGAAVLASDRIRPDTWRLARPRSLVALIAVMALVLAGFAALALPGHLGDRPRYWRVAWSEFEHHAWLGSGAGTFGAYWRAAHPLGLGALDAHSLYLETLAELGPVGLLLLVAALAVPLVQGWRSRAAPLVAAATATYTAYVVHAAFDWDWEMPAVTIVALFCAGVLFALDARAGDATVKGGSQRHTLLVLALLVGALGIATGIANSRLGA